jgi:NADPH:quinone reductase-like Zn-dependent oxidoreductase
MRAVVRERYCSPHGLELREVDKPEVTDDGVLVRVRASSVNRADWYIMTGTPYLGRVQMGLLKPKSRLLGTDFSGTVEAVGKDVTDLRPGDEVFGGKSGAFAEYVNVREAVAAKPANVTYEEAAAVPVAAVTALLALRDHGRIRPGQKVLVNGASGGVGTFAVQIAKALGGEVTGVCSTRNVELVRSLGADHVIDYTREDFTRSNHRHDLLVNVAGRRSWRDCKRVLKPDAIFVMAGASSGNRVAGPVSHLVAIRLAALGSSQKVVNFLARLTRPDLTFLGELLETGRVKPVIERTYELGEAADALRYMGEGHARGKLVITL